MRTHTQYYARSEYNTQLAKMSFDKNFNLTAGVYFYFYNIRVFVPHIKVSVPPIEHPAHRVSVHPILLDTIECKLKERRLKCSCILGTLLTRTNSKGGCSVVTTYETCALGATKHSLITRQAEYSTNNTKKTAVIPARSKI